MAIADVRALPGIRYHLMHAGDLGALVAPPYDVLTDAQVAAYEARSPYNVVRLTRPGRDYERAARTLEDWLGGGILEQDPLSMYLHEVQFAGKRRRDLIAALRLQPFEDRVVLPHERTHRGPKEDRLALMRATNASLEPLWFLYDGKRARLAEILDTVAGRKPAVTFTGPEETATRGEVRFSYPRIHADVHHALEDVQVLIADGHHRYETALTYAAELGGDASSAAHFTLALLTDMDDPGLQVLPTHRVVKAGVAVTGGEEKGSLEETLAAIRGQKAAGTYRDHRFQVIPLEGEMALVELHSQVIDNILGKRNPEDLLLYTRDPEEAVEWVDKGVGSAAFFLDAPDLHVVLKLAQEGKTLPQKSTYFHPKPPSGMVIFKLDKDRRL